MKCPPGLTPFRWDRDGVAFPMFVPAAMLESSRRAMPKLWIEAQPDILPMNRALRWDDFDAGPQQPGA